LNHLKFLLTTKTDSIVVQTANEFIRLKGQMMSTHKTGLHKDVSVIFNGVWNPEVDNIQESYYEPTESAASYVQRGPIAVNNWPGEAGFVTMIKALVKAPGYILSSRRRRERKRLSSISKHLLINIPG